jgi:hypothetical protein
MPGAVTDTLEFMKNLWGGSSMAGMNLPGMVMPTLSLEEIDKQIADLKAVESWLTLNMNMLHGTIKALEVQSATISALQSMSANFTAAMQPTESKAADSQAAFKSRFAQPAEVKPESVPKAASEPAASAPEPAAEIPPMVNPAAWWSLLQEQFNQAVASAIPAPPPATASTAKPAAKGAAKPKKTAAPAKRKTARKTDAPEKTGTP